MRLIKDKAYNKMKTEIILFLFGTLLTIVIGQKNLTVGCSTCATNICASGYCFTITGTTFNETLCVAQGKKCNAGQSETIQVNNCSVDYSSTSCLRGICFYTLSPVAFFGAVCNTSYTQQVSCGNCISSAGCGNSFCQSIIKSPSTTPQIGCVSSCPNPANTTRTVQACTNGFDSVGGANDCCMKFVTTPGAVCISQSNFLSSSSYIDNYVLGTEKNLGQYFKSLLLLLILCITVLIF